MGAVDDFPIIDIDSHITEPADLWTSRVPARYRDHVPHIRRNPTSGADEWWMGDRLLLKPGSVTMAGWGEYVPSTPPTYESFDPASYDPHARLERMDEHGVYAQILYPNVLGFTSYAILEADDPQLRLACIQAYNDFLVEFASVDPSRIIPLMCLPYWDVEASVAEIERCHDMGHHGIVFGSRWERIGFPHLLDPHWDPILSIAQERDLTINFHVNVTSVPAEEMEDLLAKQVQGGFSRANYALESSLGLAANSRCISELILGGLCMRYPNLNFVSVESGFGYVPYLLELLDWQFVNSGVNLDHPDWPLPSEQFTRQIYGSFWFESRSLSLLDQYPDNMMFETDFPHPTSLSPGAASSALAARDTVRQTMAGLDDDLVEKVLGRTAARLYHIDLPVPATTAG